MAHSVTITTPMPTLDELGKGLGLTKTQQRSIIRLVDEKMAGRSTVFAFKNRAESSRPVKSGIKKVLGVARTTKSRARKTA